MEINYKEEDLRRFKTLLDFLYSFLMDNGLSSTALHLSAASKKFFKPLLKEEK